MRKVRDVIVQNLEKQDDVLHRELFPVNMRLFKYNKKYRALVIGSVSLMEATLSETFSDYTTLKGISGANVGIPFNIIVVVDGEDVIKMINPSFTPIGSTMRKVKSNCGSLNLKEVISVKRFKKVLVRYFDENGDKHEKSFSGAVGSTIQHEIEHNKGILITDK